VAGRSGGERQQHGAPQATYPLQHDISSLRDPHAQVLGSPRGRRVSNGRRGGGIPRAPVSSAAVGGASGLAPAAAEADDNNLATLACEGGGGRPGVGLCSYPRRPAALSRIRGRGLGEARPLAASGPALPSRWPMAETGADCPALSAQPNDDLLSDLFHFPDATPPSKRRRVSTTRNCPVNRLILAFFPRQSSNALGVPGSPVSQLGSTISCFAQLPYVLIVCFHLRALCPNDCLLYALLLFSVS
jgi:hypothetical protein